MSTETSRRVFLRTTGAAVLGVGCGVPLVRALAREIDDGEGVGAGPRWAMVVDTKKCADQGDCDACRAACHKVHNVPDHDRDGPEEVKWIWKEAYENAVPGQVPEYLHEYVDPESRERQVPVLCNHCENPPCVRVCPTQATWKRDDGIVMMDMHRCIGCRYCIVGCPYGSRSFNWSDPRPYLDAESVNPLFPTRSKGVVEKCNFCAEKGRDSEDGTWTPECADACPAKALIWGNIRDPESRVRKVLADSNVYTVARKPELGTRPHVFYIV